MAENVKTLLVIGNGFDLAHGLKTKYTDFLDAINKKAGITIDAPKNTYEIQSFKKYQLSEDNAFDCVKRGNIWVGYFNKLRLSNQLNGREYWIDFEKEIELVIKQIEELILKRISIKELEQKLEWIMGGYAKQTSEIISQELVPRLNWDLKVLTLLLEQYLIGEFKNLKANRITFFENLKADAVISYNYTDTFSKLYDPNNQIQKYFVHGKLGKHNLVLGIGETLSDNEKNNFTVCAGFKKFFQRIKYRLGNNYKNIIQNGDSISKWEIRIYGHSLDTTDEDSLRWLLLDSNKFHTKILIYYYDENAYNQQIANAIQIVGKEQLIQDVNGERIVFLPTNNSN